MLLEWVPDKLWFILPSVTIKNKKKKVLLFTNRFILAGLPIIVTLVALHSLTELSCRRVCMCVCIQHDCGGPLFLVLCSAPIMNDIVVMDIHQHSDRLANDEWDPHSSVAIVSIQEPAHKPSQRNLKAWRFRGLEVCLKVISDSVKERESCVLPEPSFP